MELLYVWVEEYGNIKRQGFNFSPNYDFEVKEEKNGEYILIDNYEEAKKKQKFKEQPKNFFGDNISNITAIIGKNGSGKSTILDFLHSISNSWYFNEEGINSHKFVIIGFNSKGICIKYWLGFETELINKTLNRIKVEILEVTNNFENGYKYKIESIHNIFSDAKNDYQTITYSDIVEKLGSTRIALSNQTNDNINISSNFLLKRIINQTNEEIDRISDFENNEMIKILTFFRDYYERFNLFNLPKKLNIKLNKKEFFQWKSLVNDKPLHKATELFERITNEIYKTDLSKENNENFKIELFYIMLLIFVDTESYISYGTSNLTFELTESAFEINSNHINCLWHVLVSFKGLFEKKLINVKKVEEITKKYGTDYKKIRSKLDSQEQKIIEEFNELNNPFKIDNKMNSLYNAIDGKKSLEDKIKKIEEFEIFIKELFEKIDLSFNISESFILELHDKNNFLNLEYFKKFKKSITLYSKNDKYLVFSYMFDIHLSSGEEKLLTMFSRVYYLKKIENKIKRKSIIFLLDEPDIYLHPEWQRLFLSYFTTYISELFSKDKNIQIILTSHSPFVASDLPRENVIMLDTYGEKDEETKRDKEDHKYQKNGNCKVVKDKAIKTFGANIHSLLANSFFMESTLGEFAKQKITEVIKDLDLKIKDNKDIEENRNKEIKYIISLVGEPVIKAKLQEMYNRAFPKEHDNLLKLISSLEDEIRQLNKDKENPKTGLDALRKLKIKIEEYEELLKNVGDIDDTN